MKNAERRMWKAFNADNGNYYNKPYYVEILHIDEYGRNVAGVFVKPYIFAK